MQSSNTDDKSFITSPTRVTNLILRACTVPSKSENIMKATRKNLKKYLGLKVILIA